MVLFSPSFPLPSLFLSLCPLLSFLLLPSLSFSLLFSFCPSISIFLSLISLCLSFPPLVPSSSHFLTLFPSLSLSFLPSFPPSLSLPFSPPLWPVAAASRIFNRRAPPCPGPGAGSLGISSVALRLCCAELSQLLRQSWHIPEEWHHISASSSPPTPPPTPAPVLSEQGRRRLTVCVCV